MTSGENGDNDKDGAQNLIEYALTHGGERGGFSGTTISFTKRSPPFGYDLTDIIEPSTNKECRRPDSNRHAIADNRF